MFKVLISAPYLQNEIHQFKDELISNNIDYTVYPVKERMEENELLEVISKYDGIICGDDKITKTVIDKAKNLKVIVKWGTGIDSIDKEYANSKKIPVYNTLGAFTEPVSDSVLALILVFSRKLFQSDKIMKENGWDKAFGICLNEQSLGIIGVGRIGIAVARKAKAFGIKVYGTDIKEISKDITDELNIEMVSLDKLLQKSDFVTINCDLNETSFHLIDKETLLKMRDSAIVINTARGPIIDELELVKALENKRIAGAGLDVFEEEPLSTNSALRKMDNCILSSHNVNASPYYWGKVHRNSIDMLYKGLKNNGE